MTHVDQKQFADPLPFFDLAELGRRISRVTGETKSFLIQHYTGVGEGYYRGNSGQCDWNWAIILT